MTQQNIPKADDSRFDARDHRLGPLMAIAVACLVFVLLFFALAMAGSRAVSQTLQAFLNTKGKNVIENVEGVATEKIRYIRAVSTMSPDAAMGFGMLESGYPILEALIASLADLGRDIDVWLAQGSFSAENLQNAAAAEHLAGIVVLDRFGAVVAANLHLPEQWWPTVEPLWAGTRDLVVDLSAPETMQRLAGMIGLRRQHGDGAVVLVLDAETIGYWQTRVALQTAINEAGWRQGVHYFTVTDANGEVIAAAGEKAEDQAKGASEQNHGQGGSGPKSDSAAMAIFEVEAPLRLDGGFAGTARVGIQMAEMDRITGEHRKTIFLSTAMLIGLGVTAMGLLYVNQRRHLSRVQAVQHQLQRAEHFAGLGRLAAGVAHEIRNPLNAIGLAAQRMAREQDRIPDADPTGFNKRFITVIREEVGRLNRIVEDFLSLAKRKPTPRPVVLAAFLDDVASLMAPEAAASDITIAVQRPPADLHIDIDPDQIKQVLVNVVKNAMEAIRRDGRIAISTVVLAERRIGICIRDSGGGFVPEASAALFEPGYTTKDKGLGLGLAIAHEIVRAHGGEILAESQQRNGAVFTVVLPLSNRRPPPNDKRT